MTYEEYRANLTSHIRLVSGNIGDLIDALGYEERYSDLALVHARDGSKKLRAALDRLDALNVKYDALKEPK